MFFFIGGVEPRTKVLDETPRLCPACGLAQARLKRIDHYLTLFFIPLFPVKKGDPMLICDRCGHVASPDGRWSGTGAAAPEPDAVDLPSVPSCPRCGRDLDPSFVYCPYCGSRV